MDIEYDDTVTINYKPPQISSIRGASKSVIVQGGLDQNRLLMKQNSIPYVCNK